VPRGDPVNGVGIVRYLDAVPGQLAPKSYRPGAGGRRGRGQGRNPLLQLLGAGHERLPDSLATSPVERRENLAAAGVADGEPLAFDAGVLHPEPERIEGADAGDRLAKAGPQPARGRNSDPQPSERAGTEPYAEQVDPSPTADRRGAALDLLEQGGRVLRPPLGSGPAQRLAEDRTVAPSAGGGVLGRGIEADDDQRGVASRP
jgi:hypothetical protein